MNGLIIIFPLIYSALLSRSKLLYQHYCLFFPVHQQDEFVCEPPMITRHTSKMFVMEGQEVSLRCKSIGDPEPSTHWVSPDGKLIGNTSRTVCYENGSLDILKASVKVQTHS